jgi:endonuclease/exonuclease/phosphatase family metal-dependent hydrolase
MKTRMRAHLAFLCALAVLVPAAAAAIDVPVQGKRLALRASQRQLARRSMLLELRDPAIAAPFADPRAGGATLVVYGGAAPGQCYAAIDLDPARWEPLRGDGSLYGYRYRDRSGSARGVHRVMVRPGRIVVGARGAAFPCALESGQREPVSAVLRIDDTRYCAAFAGTVRANVAGRFRSRCAPAPAQCPKADATVATLNVLHGFFCPGNCRLADRMDLVFQWIAARGCPDVVSLQEVSIAVGAALNARLPGPCVRPYRMIRVVSSGIDDEVVLTPYAVPVVEVFPLQQGFRRVFFTRIDHPMGPLDVFSTHLAAGGDGAQNPCTGTTCAQECLDAGAATLRQCQGVQMARFIEARHDVPTPAVAVGDFNESPGTFVYDQFAGRGWTDVYLAAGNPECVPATGVGCTSGRADALSELEATAPNVDERIDYIFLVPPAAGACTIDSGVDDDGDGVATRLFADLPNPFAPSCGPAPDPICWPSDHDGVQLDLNCR